MKTTFKMRLISLFAALVMVISMVPAVAAEEKDDFKVLFIGNSYSDDATDGQYHEDSALYNIMKSMVGDRDVAVGLFWSGGKTLGWHASAEKRGEAYSFFYTDSNEGWDYKGDYLTRDALAFTDWDAVVLQPYSLELTEGFSPSMTGLLPEFLYVKDSAPYMLDLVAKYAPQAEAYLYLIWVSTTMNTVLGANASEFQKVAQMTATIETYVGKESGKAFKGVVPIGAAIQAAKSTYLGLLDYNTDALHKDMGAEIKADTQLGLQRDTIHTSRILGRYIAGLTAAKTLLPESMVEDGYTLAPMRESDTAGKLPREYLEIADLASDAALASREVTGKNKYVPRAINNMKVAPPDVISETYSDGKLTVAAEESDTALKTAVAERIRLLSGYDVNVTVSLSDTYTPPQSGGSAIVKGNVKVNHGYDSASFPIELTVKDGYTLSVTTGEGGVASFEGSVRLPVGERVGITFTPDEGYEIADVIVNGESVGKVNSLDTSSYASDTEVDVKFGRSNPFADVKEGEWYYEGVMYAFSNGYMKGTNADMTAFSPAMEFTREQFVQLLFNMEGLDAVDYAGDTGFSDVPAGQWYSAAVKWAAEAGVTSGIGGGKFGLGGKVTREQLAKFLMNYAEMRGASTEARCELSAFTDAANVSGWATDAVSFAVSEGLIGSTSTSAKVLSPGRVAVRSEIAKITMSFDAYLAK